MKRIIVGPHLIQRPVIVRPTAGMLCRGELEVSVIDSKTGKTIRTYPKQHNLLLNTFMNRLPTVSLPDMFKYCAASTGTTNTADDSGTTVAVQDGSQNVTLSGGSFTLTNTGTDAGKIIKWDTLEERRIVTVGSPTTCTVAAEGYAATAPAVSSGQFTVFRTNRTNFSATEQKRSPTGGASAYLTGAGNCGTSVNTGTGEITMTRTYDFSAEVGGVTYGEIGFGDIITAGSNLNSIIQLLTPVALVATNQLRVKYSLIVTVSPISNQTVNPSVIVGWPSNSSGKQQIQLPKVKAVDTNGNSFSLASNGECLEPSVISGVEIGVSSLSTAIATFNVPQDRTAAGSVSRSAATTAGSYVNFNYFLDKSYTFLVGEANGTIRDIVLGSSSTPGFGLTGPAFTFLMDADQTKDSLHSLQIAFRISWGRVLA